MTFRKINIASEASYVYILCKQKAKKVNLKLAVKQCYQIGQF